MPTLCKTSDLRLGDVFQLMDGAFGTAVVTQIADGQVSVFRPYTITSDFSYTGGVIPYTGTETVNLSLTSDVVYTVFQRKEVR